MIYLDVDHSRLFSNKLKIENYELNIRQNIKLSVNTSTISQHNMVAILAKSCYDVLRDSLKCNKIISAHILRQNSRTKIH